MAYELLLAQAEKRKKMFEEDENVFLHSSDEDMAREFLVKPGLIKEEYLDRAASAMYIWGCFQPGTKEGGITADNWDYQHLLVGFACDPNNE